MAAADPSALPPPSPGRISCVICAFNEADRIDGILDAVVDHPCVAEVIVVNDGSTDDTAEVLARRSDISTVSYPVNRGKTHALVQGIAAARYEYIMLLDADLAGVAARDIDALAGPVISGAAQVSLSLRSNSLGLYRYMGLDFVSGERVIPAWLLHDAAPAMARLPRWGAEVFINELIIAQGLKVAVVDWPDVLNIRKAEKAGAWRGLLEELHMIRDAVRVASLWGVVRQHIELLKLAGPSRRGGANAARAAEVDKLGYRPAP
ncbi:MAG: hypothetical protein JWM47_4105 [Acidimicrobiales bacterium]|nr:hypothetical protein [Acidimicrobiales bacterium]